MSLILFVLLSFNKAFPFAVWILIKVEWLIDQIEIGSFLRENQPINFLFEEWFRSILEENTTFLKNSTTHILFIGKKNSNIEHITFSNIENTRKSASCSQFHGGRCHNALWKSRYRGRWDQLRLKYSKKALGLKKS